jgi:hypothetical protein
MARSRNETSNLYVFEIASAYPATDVRSAKAAINGQWFGWISSKAAMPPSGAFFGGASS